MLTNPHIWIYNSIFHFYRSRKTQQIQLTIIPDAMGTCDTGYLNTHICRIKGCGGPGWPPPPIIFERLKLPQQIIYRRKENLLESPNHKKYWENILVSRFYEQFSRFYEQFSRNRRNLGHFRKFKKISNS